MTHTLRAVALSGAALLCATTAQAAPVLFSDFASWSAAVGAPTSSEDFSGLASNLDITNSSAPLGDLTFSSSMSASSGTALISAGANDLEIDAMLAADDVTVSFAAPVTAFGFFYDGFDATDDPLTVRLGGSTIASLPNGLFDFSGAFFGVVDTDGVGAFSFGTSGNGMYARIGEVTWAAAPAPVPLPAGLPLLLAGLVGLVLLRRRVSAGA